MMPKRRPFLPGELGTLQIFSVAQPKINEIERALNTGKKVEMEQSTFGDPGDDYCAVFIDDQEIVRIRGF